MHLLRYRVNHDQCCAALYEGHCYDVSSLYQDFNAAFFENGGMASLREELNQNRHKFLSIPHPNSSDLLPPFACPSKIICVGLNYADHARETGAALPSEPVIFLKANTAFAGPFEDIMLPRGSEKTDWEVELAVVISKRASYVEETEAHHYIAGYCLHNDVSERAFQLERGGTWDKGKGCDTFAPMGPYLASPEAVPDVNSLDLWLKVNAQVRQQSNTCNLIFKIPELIAYISQFMTLLPGDVISTGTPHGVGLGLHPPVYLQAGDVIELGISGLGEARQRVIAFNPSKL